MYNATDVMGVGQLGLELDLEIEGFQGRGRRRNVSIMPRSG